MLRILQLFLLATTIAIVNSVTTAEVYDVVILNGRVIDPESKTDSVRNLGITNGKIKTISRDQLSGRTTIDARSLVISPGFIDLHQHGQDEENFRFKAMDGVTSALELEVGMVAIFSMTEEIVLGALRNPLTKMTLMPAQRLEGACPR